MKILLVLLTLAGVAHAQVRDRPAVSVERLTPPPGGGPFAVVEAPDVLPSGAWAASLWTSLMSRPVVFSNGGAGVRTRLGADLGGAIGVGTRYQLGVALPIAVQWGDRLQGTGLDDRALQRVSLGDMRLHARLRILGAPGAAGWGAGLAAALALPTGDDGDFAGEAGGVLEWRVLVGWRGHGAEIAANLGVRIRHDELVLLGQTHGDEVTTGAAASVAIPRTPARVLAEAVLAIGDSIGDDRGPSPGEVRGGVGVDRGPWRVTVLGGAGVTSELGAPAWRVALGVTFALDGVTAAATR